MKETHFQKRKEETVIFDRLEGWIGAYQDDKMLGVDLGVNFRGKDELLDQVITEIQGWGLENSPEGQSQSCQEVWILPSRRWGTMERFSKNLT